MNNSQLQKTEGMIFDISRTALNDGSGIRTTVFLQGCNMNCLWCHNPESIDKGEKLLYDEKKCLKCGKCGEICQSGVHRFAGAEHAVARNQCSACRKCLAVCPTQALEICGRKVAVGEVLEIVLRDRIFYEVSNGGVTISGGEPLVQKEFTFGLLRGAESAGINTVLDTNGYWDWQDIEKMLPYIDSFHYDLKIMDSARHKFYTGVGNEIILENLQKLSGIGKDLVVVMPLIEEINGSEDNISAFVAFIKALPQVPKVQILPYHSLYLTKTKKLGRNCELFANSGAELIEKVKKMLVSEGICLYR